MKIREYKASDCEVLAQLFYDTVHSVNANDYSNEQLQAWASGDIDLLKWNESFLSHHTTVAVEDDIIIGFGDIDMTGYLDKLFVHKDYQRCGIASAICDNLETAFNLRKVFTHASITAKPFFEGRGYIEIEKQEIERNGVFLINYYMVKKL